MWESQLFVNLRTRPVEGLAEGRGVDEQAAAAPSPSSPLSRRRPLPRSPRLPTRAPSPPSGLSGLWPSRAPGLGLRGPGRLSGDPATVLSILSQTRPDKSSAERFQKLPPLPELSVPAGTLSSCKTVGFLSQEPCLDAEMEPSAAAFLNLEMHWALKDFRTLRHFGFWRVSAVAERCTLRRPCALRSPRGSGL